MVTLKGQVLISKDLFDPPFYLYASAILHICGSAPRPSRLCWRNSLWPRNDDPNIVVSVHDANRIALWHFSLSRNRRPQIPNTWAVSKAPSGYGPFGRYLPKFQSIATLIIAVLCLEPNGRGRLSKYEIGISDTTPRGICIARLRVLIFWIVSLNTSLWTLGSPQPRS